MAESRRVGRVVVAACLLGMLVLVPGCAVPSFQIYFGNVGVYPVVSVLITPTTAEDWGPERLEAAVLPGVDVMISSKFARGGVYDVAIVFDTAPETPEGNLVPITLVMDTSTLEDDYITMFAGYRQDGSNGAMYFHGL